MKSAIFLFTCLATGIFSFAQEPAAKRLKQYNVEKGLAIEGYDPVAYFILSKPLKGKKEIAYTYQGITYNFASETDKSLFVGNPTKYEPQYGGWCAYALGATGEKVSIDPETFKIINGKLYLFYHSTFNNTLKKWEKDEATLNKKADAAWPTFYH